MEWERGPRGRGVGADVPEVEEIKDAVGVDADGAPGRWRVGLVAVGMGELSDRGRGHGGLLFAGREAQVAVAGIA